MCCCELSLVRTSGRRAGRVRRLRTLKPDIFCVIPACRGGSCAAKVPDLTRGRPVDVDHMITTIVMTLTKPRGEAMRPWVADEPVVVVKHSAVDIHGDVDRGENRVSVQSSPAHGKKVEAVEAKGGTHRKTDCHPHAGKRGIEKTAARQSHHSGKDTATYMLLEIPRRNAIDPTCQKTNREEGEVRWTS